MLRETHLNALIFLALLAVPLGALVLDQPFIITLATKVTILALAGVGLNLALGQGGLVSFGHAIFFGLGVYSRGILASHAQSFTPLMEVPFVIPGTNLMPVFWIVAIAVSCLAALVVGVLSLRTSGVYFIMVTLAFGQMFYYFAISWPAYGGEDGLSIYVRNQFPGLNTLVPIQFFGLCFAVLCAVLFLVSRLNKSAFGLALTGAHATIALDDLDTLIERVKPRAVIPMHYYSANGVLDIEPVETFTKRFAEDRVTHVGGSELELSMADLPPSGKPQIFVLDQSR